MKKLIKVISLLLVSTMLFLTTACGSADTGKETGQINNGDLPANTSSSDASTSKDSAATDSERITITVLISNDNTPSAKNMVLDAITERTGYIMNPIVVQQADYQTKLSAFIAADTLPDIFGFNYVTGIDLIESNKILELTDLLNKYGPEIMKDKADVIYTGLNSQNSIWGIPYGSLITPCVVAVRTDWLENVGMEMPTDLDSFYDVMYAFTYNDPDRNGKDDTYGLCMGMDSAVLNQSFVNIFAAFGVPFNRNVQLEDGTVTSYMLHPNYLDVIMYYRKLYQNKVIEPEFATIPTMTLLERLWNGVGGIWCGNATATTQNWLGRYTEDPKPTFDYTTIYGPEGYGGSNKQYQTRFWGISAKSKHPEAAMELANYLTSEEGEELLYLGVEGVYYKWLDEEKTQYEFIPPYDDAAVHRVEGGYSYYDLFMRNTENVMYRTANELTKKGIKLGLDTALDDAFIFAPMEAERKYGDTLASITLEALSQLIVTKGDVEKEYRQFVERWLNEGGREFQEEATRLYKEQIERNK